MIPMLIVKTILGSLWKRLTALFGWVVNNPAKAALIAALIGLWWQTSALSGVRKDLVAMTAAHDAEKASHVATKASYRKAQSDAAELDRINKERVEREHAAAIKLVEVKHEANLSLARADLDRRLRTAKTRTCIASGGERTELPSVSTVPSGAMWSGGEAIVHEHDLGTSVSNTVRLESIIAAWKAAASVDVNRAH